MLPKAAVRIALKIGAKSPHQDDLLLTGAVLKRFVGDFEIRLPGDRLSNVAATYQLPAEIARSRGLGLAKK